MFFSTAITTFSFHSAHLHLFQELVHQIKTSSISTSQPIFFLSSRIIIFLSLWLHNQAVFVLIESIEEISSELIHCLLVTINHHIKNTILRGILSLSNTVHAVTQSVVLQLAQILTLLFQCLQYFSLEHFGQAHHQRICSKYKRHCSSVWNWSINSIMFFGYIIATVYSFL